jgi:polyribonucleotide nucleotidyltransferase
MVRKFHSTEFGYEVEIGGVARQADSAVWFKHGDTVILATVVSAPSKEFPGFLPLTIDYREQFSAAGKIPGGYYKREGKFTDKEILTSRLIDRPIRPLFPSNYFDQIQILATVYSVDKEHTPAHLAVLASSLALTISKIPFLGPVGVVELARLNGEWIVNPSYDSAVKSTIRLVIAGTDEGICMVEGSADELSEQDFLDAMFFAHDIIKKQVAWQLEIQKEIGQPKEEIADQYNWKLWEGRVDQFLTDERVRNTYIEDKVERNEYLNSLREAFITEYQADIEAQEVPESVIEYIFDAILKLKVTELIFTLGKRIDGRDFNKVRNISTKVGILPSTHGSALFTRGRTQALVTVTLGSGEDEQKIEGLMDGMERGEGAFMLHYNFPPFSVGEVRPMRGPGRREVGHGYLAQSALTNMLPDKENFPYTIRIVADMLESDGSTSMATVCGSTMALMNTGVPIKKMVGGVAMGLLKNQKGDFAVLTDINGFEDAYGLMDFKVAGTDTGITAIQMDIKYKGGFSRQVFEAALEQARHGRLHILGEMKKVQSEPNKSLSPLVPKVVSLKVSTDKIGAIIGQGGKVIREIIEKTGVTSIDISDEGVVKIFGQSNKNIEQAERWVKTIAGQIERGARYKGTVRRQAEFGLFVELVPGQDGLVHISNIPKAKQKSFVRDYPVGQEVEVEVVEYDSETGRIRLRLIEEASTQETTKEEKK